MLWRNDLECHLFRFLTINCYFSKGKSVARRESVKIAKNRVNSLPREGQDSLPSKKTSSKDISSPRISSNVGQQGFLHQKAKVYLSLSLLLMFLLNKHYYLSLICLYIFNVAQERTSISLDTINEEGYAEAVNPGRKEAKAATIQIEDIEEYP